MKNLCDVNEYRHYECSAFDDPQLQRLCKGYEEDEEDQMRRCDFYGSGNIWLRCGNTTLYAEAELMYKLEDI